MGVRSKKKKNMWVGHPPEFFYWIRLGLFPKTNRSKNDAILSEVNK